MMSEIQYFDRYAGEIRTEKIYGEKYLRWIYETVPGRLALWSVVRRAWFSRWYGRQMDLPESKQRIEPFIDEYDLSAEEFLCPPEKFESFNAFFSRRLLPEARPIAADPASVVFPADGRHLCVPDLSDHSGLFVKGEKFDLPTLLGDAELAKRYQNGSLLLSRLCPVDYHRFHFPFGGRPGDSRLINGPLYSVNPLALSRNIHILSMNKRTVTVLETDILGPVLLLEVGATCVGSICQTYRVGRESVKGDEKGYFRFGGSSTITVFQPGRIRFDDDLVRHSAEHRELYARMGDQMGLAVARDK